MTRPGLLRPASSSIAAEVNACFRDSGTPDRDFCRSSFSPSSASAASAEVDPSEYAERRAQIAEAVGDDAIVLLFSPRPQRRNGGVDWPFRQEDNLFYLTGVDQPHTTLALLPGEEGHEEILFARDRDPLSEIWDGRIPEHSELADLSGVAEVVSADGFDRFLGAALEGGSWGSSELYRYYRPPGLPATAKRVEAGEATVWLLLEQRPNGEPTRELRFADDLRARFPELSFRDLTPIVEAMREVKSPAEQAILQRSVDITAQAIERAMRRTLDAEHEYEVQAAIEGTFRELGACCPGYGSIVASGENATVLHYVTNDQPIDRDGLMLLDVGAEVEHYTADITRTYPADGTFSEAQREIYEIVLDAWADNLRFFRAGGSLREAHENTLRLFGERLLELGLVTEASQEQVELYFMHGVGHPIGMFVHDVFDRTRPFEPGMVATNEPGLYVRPADVRASSVYASLDDADRATIEAALERYGGIGVRIEDDILVTEGEPEVLSRGLARTVEEIEAAMARR